MFAAFPYLSVLLFVLLRVAVCQGQQQKTPAALDAYVQAQMKQYKIPGLSVLVLKNGKVLKNKGYGLASVEFAVPTSDRTVYALASVTKIFTATLIMQLVEQGKLSLQDPVAQYVDSLPESWHTITIRHLLNHTSGIRNHFMNPAWATLEKAHLSPQQAVVKVAAALPLAFRPGEQYAYSVTGYLLLGMVVQKVTGRPFEEYITRTLFAPLHMQQTQFGDYRTVIPNRSSTIYTYQNGPFETWTFTYGNAGFTAAGLNSTTTDLAKFFTALHGGALLSPASLDSLFTPTRLPSGQMVDYGLGWVIEHYRGRTCYGHEGGGCAWVNYYRSEGLTIAVLANLTGSKADAIIKGIADFYLK
ncbi:serine hydrolase domain-containing protein [Hymenobacter sp. BT491]|uniref:serine hydrolase domain-containing protein n=1 Tax=Hymenobacter sp. BT491 TaxID=2766779 RepID=UPI0016535164|nr:serine hydrolase domain-containing protein [Hymenobacter sp. BT491]MBC6988697.1 beta-lactamase family protein [Hymenobacter sp. BT491]